MGWRQMPGVSDPEQPFPTKQPHLQSLPLGAQMPSAPTCSLFLSNVPSAIAPHLPDLGTDPLRFTEVKLELEWIKDTPTQVSS